MMKTNALARLTGVLLILEVVMFSLTILIGNTNGFAPGVDRPLDELLPAVAHNNAGLIIVYLAYVFSGILLVPIALFLPRLLSLAESETPLLRIGAAFGVLSAFLRTISVSRYLFFVPLLADTYVNSSATTRANIVFAYQSNDAFAGAGLGEYLGDGLFLGIWLLLLTVAILRYRELPPWLGWLSGAVGVIVFSEVIVGFLPQAGIFPVIGLSTSYVWFLLLAGVLLLRSRARTRSQIFASS